MSRQVASDSVAHNSHHFAQDYVTTKDRGRHWIEVVKRRWPTVLALAMSAATWDSDGSDNTVAGLGQALPLLPLLYLIVAKIRQPRASWPVLVAGLAATVVLRVLDVLAPSVFFVAVALVVLVWATIDGQLRSSGMFQIQALGMLGFGALALVGLAVDPDVGRYLVRRLAAPRRLGLRPPLAQQGRGPLVRRVVRPGRHPDRHPTSHPAMTAADGHRPGQAFNRVGGAGQDVVWRPPGCPSRKERARRCHARVCGKPYSDLHHHVGMYVGNGLIVHASRAGVPVKMARMDTMPYMGARRPG